MSDEHFPPEYYEQIRQMDRAARAWYAAHPFAEPRFCLAKFENEIKRAAGRPEHEHIAIAVGLDKVIDRIADNGDARALLREMDRASGHQATYLQAKVLLDLAIEAHIKRGQGEQPAGDWACTGCGENCDGFSRTDGTPEVPPPGSPAVCAHCGQTQQINATANGWDKITEAELRTMPKSLRMRLLELRNVIRKGLAAKQERS